MSITIKTTEAAFTARSLEPCIPDGLDESDVDAVADALRDVCSEFKRAEILGVA